jgi:GAF domain-containing protein
MSEQEQPPLRRILAELSPFLATDRSIGDSLHRVSRLAVDAVPPAMFAGITMMVDDRVTTQAFTDPTCPHIDQAQYESGHGPCLDAFKSGSVVHVVDLGRDGRWPEFAAAATAHGVRSTLSLPLLAGDESMGALNLYADAEGAFDEQATEIGRIFAARATEVLVNAQAYWGARLTSEDLERALADRQVIDVAAGVITSSLGCNSDEAFARLVEQSHAENRNLHELAADIVARAQRRRS